MEEVEEVVEARQRILTEEDAKLAHYTSWMISPHAGKRTPKPEKLRRIKDASDDDEQTPRRPQKVVSIAEHKRAKSAIARSRQQVPWEGSG